jgi:transposase
MEAIVSRTSKLVDNELISKASSGLKLMGNYGRLSVKLKALIACGENSITAVSKIFGVSRYTLNEWINTLKNGEVSDLEIKQGRGRCAIVPEMHYQTIKSWLIRNPQLTTDEVQDMISKNLSIDIGRTATYNLIKKLGLSYITPRPSHHKKDASTHEAFKKTSGKGKK